MFRVRGRHRRRLLVKADDRAAAIAAVRAAVEGLAADRSASRDVADRRRRRPAVASATRTLSACESHRGAAGTHRQAPTGASARSVEIELIERREAALAQVVKFGDPVLKSRASPVTEFGEELRAEVERMIAIMRDGLGVGLAATQLGILRRVLVFQASNDAQPTALINPEVEWTLGRAGDRRGGLPQPAAGLDGRRAPPARDLLGPRRSTASR